MSRKLILPDGSVVLFQGGATMQGSTTVSKAPIDKDKELRNLIRQTSKLTSFVRSIGG